MGPFIVFACAMLACVEGIGAPQPSPDPSFERFLGRFIADEGFRLKRVKFPLTAKLGDGVSQDVVEEKWSREEVREKLTPILSKSQLAQNGIEESVKQVSCIEVEILQFKPEADSYIFTYRFHSIDGRWYLTAFEDASM